MRIYRRYPRMAINPHGGQSPISLLLTLNCGVLGPRIEAHRGLVFITTTTALGTGCASLLQCLGRFSLPPSAGW